MPVISQMIVCRACGCTYEFDTGGYTDICNNCMLQVEISCTESELQQAKIEVGRFEDKLRDLNSKLTNNYRYV